MSVVHAILAYLFTSLRPVKAVKVRSTKDGDALAARVKAWRAQADGYGAVTTKRSEP